MAAEKLSWRRRPYPSFGRGAQPLSLSGCTFEACVAYTGAAVAHVLFHDHSNRRIASPFSADACTFASNRAKISGGAVSMAGNCRPDTDPACAAPVALADRVTSYFRGGMGAASSPFEPPTIASSSSAPAPAAVERPTREVLAARLEEALEIRSLLLQNTQELDGVLRALGGGYVLPEAGGDLLRDGTGVLPTGRNIHALDPYRMPSPAAMARGSAVAAAVLQQHLDAAVAGGDAAAVGRLPETVAVNLWGLDSIKSKGESVAVVLALVGAVPVREGTGRVARFELVPLEQLGRPRVDVLCNMSGIFRDSFQNVVELLDDLFARAAAAPEPDELNYIAKHARAIWTNGDELADTWAARNAFSYGRGKERGTARPEVLQALLRTTDRIVQQIDSVEYGLTDIQAGGACG
ncbi:Magnesium-chelatase subunit H [Tetrabaena socialis]|uniref:Magnesium-chelatase subunit H n=1 Tax=Tetrabaena socialis TaxID=47790 RepID=A0A2J7ZNA6_9CHLO|nr:Magnesium-chelatase subunit H [Tetrabaena socialis]|eukprot:PNH01730.1 Magnesium-chelatase subunit H [Tetrabaena socialis]